jgi:hypothetical protein
MVAFRHMVKTLLSLSDIAKSDHFCVILCYRKKDFAFRDASCQTAQLLRCIIRVHVPFDEGPKRKYRDMWLAKPS